MQSPTSKFLTESEASMEPRFSQQALRDLKNYRAVNWRQHPATYWKNRRPQLRPGKHRGHLRKDER